MTFCNCGQRPDNLLCFAKIGFQRLEPCVLLGSNLLKGTLYLDDAEIATLDETRVSVFKTYDEDPIRVSYRTRRLNTGKTFTELERHRVLRLVLDDGRKANVIYQHACLDAEGQLAGVLRVLGDFWEENPQT